MTFHLPVGKRALPMRGGSDSETTDCQEQSAPPSMYGRQWER